MNIDPKCVETHKDGMAEGERKGKDSPDSNWGTVRNLLGIGGWKHPPLTKIIMLCGGTPSDSMATHPAMCQQALLSWQCWETYSICTLTEHLIRCIIWLFSGIFHARWQLAEYKDELLSKPGGTKMAEPGILESSCCRSNTPVAR